MLKLAPELTERQQFEQETYRKWKDYVFQPRKKLPILEGERYVDIGCGSGLWNQVDGEFWALDVVPKELGVKFVQECFPYTSLPDDYFDVVYCIDLIAELPENLYRLALSELARIMKREGKLVVSSEMDTKTNEACRYFRSLVRTEFVIEKEEASYLPFRKLLFGDAACTHLTLVASKKSLI